jgi:hypothetical protein
MTTSWRSRAVSALVVARFEQLVGWVGQERGGDQKDRGVVSDGALPDLVCGLVVSADEPADQGLVVVGHG